MDVIIPWFVFETMSISSCAAGFVRCSSWPSEHLCWARC